MVRLGTSATSAPSPRAASHGRRPSRPSLPRLQPPCATGSSASSPASPLRNEATAWAQRALGAKNTLRDVDAAIVEAAFASRMAELGEGGESPLPSPTEAGEGPAETAEPPGRAELMAALRASAELGAATEAPLPADRRRRKRRSREQPLSASPQPAAPAQPAVQPQPEVPPVNNAVVWHVDKSALSLSEPRRYRDRAHLKFVASQPCLRCERQPAEPHHLRFVQPRALGRKVSDEYAVPLCRTHHREVHRQGDEAAWWASAGIDALAVAHRLWQHTRLNGAPIQEHIDPLLGPPSVQAAEMADRAARGTCTPMTSWRQWQANRLNALKSTGPRTEEGKRISRRNALRHGLTAETVIDGLEDSEDYRGFEAAIIADYDAETAVERELVLRLASLLWRLRRIIAIETDLFAIQAEILRDRRSEVTTAHGEFTNQTRNVVMRAEDDRLSCSDPPLIAARADLLLPAARKSGQRRVRAAWSIQCRVMEANRSDLASAWLDPTHH